MIRLAHTAVVRLAAAGVALALAGAPQLLAPPAAEAVHHCQCQGAGEKHECDCPFCHPRAAEAARRRAASSPCLSSSCGGADGQLLPPRAADRFLVPVRSHLISAPVIERLADALELPVWAFRDPETPPPRGA